MRIERSIAGLKRNFASLKESLKTGSIEWTTDYFSIAGNTTHCTLMLTPLGAEVLREIVKELEERGEDVSFLKELCEKRRFEGEMAEETFVFVRLLVLREELRSVLDSLSRALSTAIVDIDLGKKIFKSALIQVGGLIDSFNFSAEKLGFEDRLSIKYEEDSWEIKGVIGDKKIEISGSASEILELASFLGRMDQRIVDMIAEAGRRSIAPGYR